MAKTELRRRFVQPARDPGRYHRQILEHRADPENPEPESEQVEVTETWAVQAGKKVKIRVYADQVEDYEQVFAEWQAAQAGGES